MDAVVDTMHLMDEMAGDICDAESDGHFTLALGYVVGNGGFSVEGDVVTKAFAGFGFEVELEGKG